VRQRTQVIRSTLSRHRGRRNMGEENFDGRNCKVRRRYRTIFLLPRSPRMAFSTLLFIKIGVKVELNLKRGFSSETITIQMEDNAQRLNPGPKKKTGDLSMQYYWDQWKFIYFSRGTNTDRSDIGMGCQPRGDIPERQSDRHWQRRLERGSKVEGKPLDA